MKNCRDAQAPGVVRPGHGYKPVVQALGLRGLAYLDKVGVLDHLLDVLLVHLAAATKGTHKKASQ